MRDSSGAVQSAGRLALAKCSRRIRQSLHCQRPLRLFSNRTSSASSATFRGPWSQGAIASAILIGSRSADFILASELNPRVKGTVDMTAHSRSIDPISRLRYRGRQDMISRNQPVRMMWAIERAFRGAASAAREFGAIGAILGWRVTWFDPPGCFCLGSDCCSTRRISARCFSSRLCCRAAKHDRANQSLHPVAVASAAEMGLAGVGMFGTYAYLAMAASALGGGAIVAGARRLGRA